MVARILANKAKRLEKKLHKLQAEIYDFKDQLEEKHLGSFAELAGEAGFELDESHIKMKKLYQGIERAFCSKVSE